PVAEDQRALVQAALRDAGALPDLLPGGAEGERQLSAGAAAADWRRASRRDPLAPGGARRHLDPRRLRRGAACLPRPGVLRLPDRLHTEPPRAALRHRSDRSGEVGHADARPLVLGLRVSQLELPPRTPLLRRRPVLPPAGVAARARAVLPAARD